MKVPILSIKDDLVGFGATFTVANEEVAKRGFRNSIVRDLKDGVVNDVSPKDLSLYLLGTFDTVTGVIKSIPPKCILQGHVVEHEYYTFKLDMDDSEKVGEE